MTGMSHWRPDWLCSFIEWTRVVQVWHAVCSGDKIVLHFEFLICASFDSWSLFASGMVWLRCLELLCLRISPDLPLTLQSTSPTWNVVKRIFRFF
jgi:hypothetical protein